MLGTASPDDVLFDSSVTIPDGDDMLNHTILKFSGAATLSSADLYVGIDHYDGSAFKSHKERHLSFRKLARLYH